jgi:hypothetical protein
MRRKNLAAVALLKLIKTRRRNRYFRRFEFGSNKYKQFPIWSGSNPGGGAGSKGYFIYPTLREEQPYLIGEWEKGFDKIIKEWT